MDENGRRIAEYVIDRFRATLDPDERYDLQWRKLVAELTDEFAIHPLADWAQAVGYDDEVLRKIVLLAGTFPPHVAVVTFQRLLMEKERLKDALVYAEELADAEIKAREVAEARCKSLEMVDQTRVEQLIQMNEEVGVLNATRTPREITQRAKSEAYNALNGIVGWVEERAKEGIRVTDDDMVQMTKTLGELIQKHMNATQGWISKYRRVKEHWRAETERADRNKREAEGRSLFGAKMAHQKSAWESRAVQVEARLAEIVALIQSTTNSEGSATLRMLRELVAKPEPKCRHCKQVASHEVHATDLGEYHDFEPEEPGE